MARGLRMDVTSLCPDRRRFLAGIGAFVAWANMPREAFAGSRDPRFVAVVLRGAMDGLAVVPPVGDPDYSALRGDLAIGVDGEGVQPLHDIFALNAAMPRLGSRYRSGEVLIAHAVATPYRDRSHFDGQDVLESGYAGPRASDTGWLNRAVGLLPRGERVEPVSGLGVGASLPLILRGPAPTLTWAPKGFQPVGDDTTARLEDLYGQSDAAMARVLAAGLRTDELVGVCAKSRAGGGPSAMFRALGEGAGRLLSQEAGPRIAAISLDGWDTHTSEGPETGRLAKQLGGLDAALDALAQALGPAWKDTVVAVTTEFGRTAHTNGNDGTDHGTATTAFLVGGAVRGGRVVADWPGLRARDLYQERDLAPTTDLRALLKGVLRDHLGLAERELANTVFPGSIGVRPLDGLVA